MNPLAEVFNVLGGLFLLAILLRFLLQLARADFYNPVSQAVVRVTDPMVRVFRTFVPGYRNVDFAALVLAFVVEGIAIYVLILLYGGSLPGVGFLVTWSILGVVYFIINIYWYAIIASIIMSFVMLFSGSMNPHPILLLVWQLTDPVMAPFRKIIPPMGGLDFSPIFVFILLRFILNFLNQNFASQQVSLVVIGI
ncbi:MAG: YggT family protein [Gammaproteobacteria bacterium]|nr:YggT family protein [Gammaproteobacteria bacterium]MCY3687457.1 YggT family protein [Gammaproteobacteria bacterium]MDE0479327.1 YggT family protein [Gammaproteobacteria bacterium]MDE0509604.1 YggT family protein [Gammaproteobacteria bacterium]MXZ33542.1 YggT family protein [Gammaproteobacteria bacterium]